MNAAVLLIISIAILVVGYIFYGGWLAKKWGVDPKNVTPSHTMEDVEYTLNAFKEIKAKLDAGAYDGDDIAAMTVE